MNNDELVDDYLSKYYLGKIDLVLDIIGLIKKKVKLDYSDSIYVTSGIAYCNSQLYCITEYLESGYDLPDSEYIRYKVFVIEEELKLLQSED